MRPSGGALVTLVETCTETLCTGGEFLSDLSHCLSVCISNATLSQVRTVLDIYGKADVDPRKVLHFPEDHSTIYLRMRGNRSRERTADEMRQREREVLLALEELKNRRQIDLDLGLDASFTWCTPGRESDFATMLEWGAHRADTRTKPGSLLGSSLPINLSLGPLESFRAISLALRDFHFLLTLHARNCL